MKYCIYFMWYDGKGSSLSEILKFNSAEERSNALPNFQWADRKFLFEVSTFSLDEIYLRLLENDPLGDPKAIYERAKMAFSLMEKPEPKDTSG